MTDIDVEALVIARAKETRAEARRTAIREMVKKIRCEPLQDMHFDLWAYPGQAEVFGMQPYEHSVIREYVKVVGGDNPSPALVAIANFLLLG
jgi:hypothetical protein